MLILIFYIMLISFITVFFCNNTIGRNGSTLISVISMLMCFLLTVTEFIKFISLESWATAVIEIFEWIKLLYFSCQFYLIIDGLSIIMLLVVITISTLVQIYSVYYMEHDPNKPIFFSYLTLFTFFMSLLVTSSNFVSLFVGWEGVGICSFLLISFWKSRPQANKSAFKAMLINRIGDFFLIAAIAVMFITFKSVDFFVIFSQAHVYVYKIVWSSSTLSLSVIDIICFLLIFGVITKSAQIGFHGWLPDAMEGPTPVSALIHAATMVTAGVFLVIRCSYLFEFSPISSLILVYLSSTTIVVFGLIGLFQFDIKKIIAYSTCSQLGYMILACSLSAYHLALYHLLTHATFKALLFLSAGSIIHLYNNEQDIRKINGLYEKSPYLSSVFLIALLSLVGFPFFSGYYSKEAIINVSYWYNGNPVIYLSSLIGVSLTTLYSLKLVHFLFFKEIFNSRINNIQKSVRINYFNFVPLGILALLSIFSGFLFKEIFLGLGSNFFYGAILNLPNKFPIFYEFLNPIFRYASYFSIIIGCIIYSHLVNINYFFKNSRISEFFNKRAYVDSLLNIFFIFYFYRSMYFFYFFFDKGIFEYVGYFGFKTLLDTFSIHLQSKLYTKYSFIYTYYFILSFVIIIVYFFII